MEQFLNEESITRKCFTNEILDILTLREKLVLELRFGLIFNKSMTLKQVANYLEDCCEYPITSAERIRGIETKALKKIRKRYINLLDK